MKVKVQTPTDLQLETGRRFSVAQASEVDLDELGYSAAEQEELASKHWIEPIEDDEGATDAARKLADEHELDLAGITGTGVGGRIVKSDVTAAIAEEKAAEEKDDESGGDEEDEDEASGDDDEEDEDG